MGEFVGLAASHPLLASVILLTAVCGVVRHWISHRTTVRHEAQATRRMQLAVDGTSSSERAAVVRACAELEAASHSVPPSIRPCVDGDNNLDRFPSAAFKRRYLWRTSATRGF